MWAHWASFLHPHELSKPNCPELLQVYKGGACRNHGAHEHNKAYSHGPLYARRGCILVKVALLLITV